MANLRITAERVIDAPADTVYRCIADYRQHHRPGGFLPPAFSDFHIERGGVGAGTIITFNMTLGGRTRSATHAVAEPEPGRVLVESGDGVTTTFTVESVGPRCRVRFDTLLEATGFAGISTRLFAPFLLRRLYAEELALLERYARDQYRQSLASVTPSRA